MLHTLFSLYQRRALYLPYPNLSPTLCLLPSCCCPSLSLPHYPQSRPIFPGLYTSPARELLPLLLGPLAVCVLLLAGIGFSSVLCPETPNLRRLLRSRYSAHRARLSQPFPFRRASTTLNPSSALHAAEHNTIVSHSNSLLPY